MSSLIPKTTVGIDSRKYRRNQSCMVHGTSEIGYVFPTYARNYINDATVNLGTRTGVRLSPLFVPTMGKLDVRHYHCFVPWNRVYSPFDAFLAREPFNFEGGVAIPQYLPKIKMGEIISGLFFRDSFMPNYGGRGLLADGATFADWIQSGQLNVGLTCSIYKAETDSQTGLPKNYELVDWSNDTTHGEILTYLFSGGISSFFGYSDNYDRPVCAVVPSMLRTSEGDFFVNLDNISGSFPTPLVPGLTSVADGSRSHIVTEYLSSLSYPSLENCDFSYEVKAEDVTDSGWYTVCFNFNGALKRLRSICLGLGYSFNPFDMESDCMLKFLAFYRAWFSLFGVTRDINFNDTAAASISRLFTTFYTNDDWRVFGSYIPLNNADNLMYEFFKSLCDLTYTCPADYFTSSVQNTQQGVENDAVSINGDVTGYSIAGAKARGDLTPAAPAFSGGDGNYVSAISIQIAQRLLRWVNKNTVVGRKIADILYARYGKIKTDDDSSEGVYKIGVDTTPIEIGIIFNQTSSEGSAPLGEFSGIGSGGGRAPKHSFTTPSYGVFITLTAVVPEMGYFQGKLRENSDGIRDSFEFPDTAFDALGWQTVRYNELVSDRQFHRQDDALSSGTSLGVYGRQPRYTHYKVGFNRVLGDISLPHMANNMLSYTLDRYFNPRDEYLPVNNPATSRRGTIGGTNRIFEVVSPTDDHIIYQIYFDINVNDRLKPLSLSYDTILEGDDKSADFGHE